MSSLVLSDKRLNNNEATKIIKSLYLKNSSCLIISKHCEIRMLERDIVLNDVINIIKLGKCTGSELHEKSHRWVYRIETSKFRLECNINKNIIAITVIRKKGSRK